MSGKGGDDSHTHALTKHGSRWVIRQKDGMSKRRGRERGRNGGWNWVEGMDGKYSHTVTLTLTHNDHNIRVNTHTWLNTGIMGCCVAH